MMISLIIYCITKIPINACSNVCMANTNTAINIPKLVMFLNMCKYDATNKIIRLA